MEEKKEIVDKTEKKEYGSYFMGRTVADIMEEYSEQHDEWKDIKKHKNHSRRKNMTLSKTERILSIINYYLPHEDLYQYNFEADSIAYNTKSNSSLKTIQNLIRKYLGEAVDEEMVEAMAAAIKNTL